MCTLIVTLICLEILRFLGISFEGLTVLPGIDLGNQPVLQVPLYHGPGLIYTEAPEAKTAAMHRLPRVCSHTHRLQHQRTHTIRSNMQVCCSRNPGQHRST